METEIDLRFLGFSQLGSSFTFVVFSKSLIVDVGFRRIRGSG
jgi:hypothetical protein